MQFQNSGEIKWATAQNIIKVRGILTWQLTPLHQLLQYCLATK